MNKFRTQQQLECATKIQNRRGYKKHVLSEYLLWFWFYDTRLEATLYNRKLDSVSVSIGFETGGCLPGMFRFVIPA